PRAPAVRLVAGRELPAAAPRSPPADRHPDSGRSGSGPLTAAREPRPGWPDSADASPPRNQDRRLRSACRPAAGATVRAGLAGALPACAEAAWAGGEARRSRWTVAPFRRRRAAEAPPLPCASSPEAPARTASPSDSAATGVAEERYVARTSPNPEDEVQQIRVPARSLDVRRRVRSNRR